jgi:RNA polymerase sigma-70 factor (ECF subfamily)
MHGNPDFTRLVDQHYAALYRFALSLAGNESDASDLVQETFYIWATKGHQVRDLSKARSWLFTTLHRHFLAGRRQRVRFPQHELNEVQDELPEVPPEFSAQPDWELVVACLARIDPVFQGPVALFYLEDYSYNEIADILEIPLGTVKSRMARGIAQLQQALVRRTSNRPSQSHPTHESI